MHIGILGTGDVGQTIGTKLIQLGHEVCMGSRDPANPKAIAWAKQEGEHASFGNFSDAAKFGEIIFNCTLGSASLDALRQAGEENLDGKILIDTSNPLDYSQEIWTLTVGNNDSLGEQIQRAYPRLKVVKSLNTVNCNVMVEPSKLIEKTDIFVGGNDLDAKATVVKMLREGFGWKSVIDLGDIRTSRAVEAYVLFWQCLRNEINSARFNIRLVSA